MIATDNPVLIRRIKDLIGDSPCEVINEGGERLTAETSRDMAIRWCVKNNCQPVRSFKRLHLVGDYINFMVREGLKTAKLKEAAEYTLSNLDAAHKEKLITAPKWMQAQLGESAKMLRAALAQ